MSKYQIATKPGHRAAEHLYTIKSILGSFQQQDKAMILSMWDLKKFFDRESLFDCMNELYKNNLKGKLYRLIYELNKNVRIQVQTAVGLTEEKDTGPSVAQGSVEGALISAVTPDNGVKDFFADSDEEVSYGDLLLRPLIFQDDVARLSEDRQSAQSGNDKMETMIETKLLDFNLDKSYS